MPGSTLGGHSTPSLRASVSLRFSFRPLPVVLGLFLPGSVVPGGFVEGGSTRDVAPGSQAFGSDGGAAMLCVEAMADAASNRPTVSVVPALRVMLGPCVVPFRGQPLPGRSGSGCVNRLQNSALAEADQREMPHRRHRPALDHLETGAARPIRQPCPGKLRTPAEPSRQRREALLENAAKAVLRAEMIDQDDFAAGVEHAGEIVEP